MFVYIPYILYVFYKQYYVFLLCYIVGGSGTGNISQGGILVN